MKSRDHEGLPAEATYRERARHSKEQAKKKMSAGEVNGKFRLSYEEFPGRWTERFFKTEEKRDKFLKNIDCNYKLW